MENKSISQQFQRWVDEITDIILAAAGGIAKLVMAVLDAGNYSTHRMVWLVGILPVAMVYAVMHNIFAAAMVFPAPIVIVMSALVAGGFFALGNSSGKLLKHDWRNAVGLVGIIIYALSEVGIQAMYIMGFGSWAGIIATVVSATAYVVVERARKNMQEIADEDSRHNHEVAELELAARVDLERKETEAQLERDKMIADAKREQQRLDAETERELALLEEQRNNADKIVAEQLRQKKRQARAREAEAREEAAVSKRQETAQRVELLRAYLSDNPKATQQEMATFLGVSVSTAKRLKGML